MKDIITIDGPSGAGKSTVAKLLAKRLGYDYLDTGALYRAVAWEVREKKIDIEDEKSLEDILKTIDIICSRNKIMVDGMDITSEIRTEEIGELSSKLSAKPIVRDRLLAIQREIGLKGKVVMEGRDIGSVIFPEAENKFFVNASVEKRGERRYRELKDRAQNPIETVIEDIRKRDHRDSSRKFAPLKRADDMVYIDTSNLSVEDVITKIMEALKRP